MSENPYQRSGEHGVPLPKDVEEWFKEITRHECSFASHPFNKRVEYCQVCGVLREASDG